MVEALVFLAVERITDFLIDQGVFLHGVREKVMRLQDELKRMQCFLKDADRKQEQDERVRNWVVEIRDVAYEVEDVIDTFILNAATGRGKGSYRFIERLTSIFTKGPQLHHTGNKIKSIRVKIGDISTAMQTYGIKFVGEEKGFSSASEMQQRLRRSDPYDEEEHVISLENCTRELMAQLMIEVDQLRVVSIVGMGGLGKTTLAKKVYNHVDVKRHFDCYSWAFISQQFSPRDVLFGILIEVAPEEDRRTLVSMKEEELVKTLKNVLKRKRYLVVLDDIWEEKAWDCIKGAFPKGKKGSKVLLTTRIKEVTLYADPWSSMVEPPFLTTEEGWELLIKKAFPKDIVCKHNYPPELEKLGKEMVRKCGGLPLAISVLGGLLANKSLKEWEMVQRDTNTQFIKMQQNYQYAGVNWILALSYDDLPCHLKPCFLYLSQFPEDSEIQKKTLIRMWIAEGFVSPQLEGGDNTMEDVAEKYLEDLVNRCMVQVSQRDHTGISVKKIRIHDLMRDMCLSKVREENFLKIAAHQEDTTANGYSNVLHIAETKSRRIAIHPHIHQQNLNKKFNAPLVKGNPHLRSLIYFVENSRYGMTRQQGTFLFKNFRLLRVLNLQDVYLYDGYIPTGICNLIHLRYLGLRNTRLCRKNKYICFMSTSLPESIGNLRSLYTLDLRDNYWLRLPDVLSKLECLRHLLIDRDDVGHFRLDTLRHLETLTWVEAKNVIRNNAVFKLTNLRNLGIYFETMKEAEVVLKSTIFRLGLVRSLNMRMRWQNFPNLEPLSHCHHLTKLQLDGKIVEDVHSLDHNLKFLPASLAKLSLCHSHLRQDPMAILEKLPNLRFLSLDGDSYKGSIMVCSAYGFPQLEILKLRRLNNIEEWRVEEGAMPLLKTLDIDSLRELRMIPEGLKFVSTLRELNIRWMPEAFEKRIRVIKKEEGEDFDKVRHIPSIMFYP